MMTYNVVPCCNREIRRKVEKYQRKHPGLTFTQAYNQIYGTKYDEPDKYKYDTSTAYPQNGSQNSTAMDHQI